MWHTLRNAGDPLHHAADALHRAPQLLTGLPQGPGIPAPKPPPPHAQDRWIPPSLIQDTPAALDAIIDVLDAGTIPVSASLLVAPVLDPDGGVLERLSAVLASVSRYAQQRGAAPELWQDLGRAGQDLGDMSETLAGSVAALATLPAAAGPTPGARTSPGLPAPAAGGAAGRRR